MAFLGVAILSAGMTFAVFQFDENTNTPSTQATSSFLKGHLTAVLKDEDGNVKAYRQTDNLITGFGLETIIKQTFGNSTLDGTSTSFNVTTGNTVKTMAIGEGTTAPGYDDGDLGDRTNLGSCGNNTLLAWKLSDGGANTDPNHNDALVIVANSTFTGSAGCGSGGGISVTEAGLFTSPSGGSTGNDGSADAGYLFARQTFTAVSVTTSDTLTINWDITFADN